MADSGSEAMEKLVIQFESSVPAELFARICLAVDHYAPDAQVEMLDSDIGPRAKFYLPSRGTRYADHILANTSQDVLDVAREVMRGAAEEHDVSAELADSLADAVVAALVRAGYINDRSAP